MRQLLGIVLAAAVAMSACGGSKAPAAPTAPSTPGATVSGTPAGPTATVIGTVQGATAGALSSISSGPAILGVTITVMGTSISTTIDSAGRFTLMNVPTGTVQLQLSGGASGTVTLASVQAAQTVDVVLVVNGSSASLASEVRSGAGEAEVEGRVESLPPSTPALTFRAAGRNVKTDSATRFVDGSVTRSFADLRIGSRVHARGTLAGDTLTASIVEMQNENLPNVPNEVEVNGVIDTLTGNASAFSFRIGSRLIRGDTQTQFFGDGNRPDTFASLRNTVRVEVKGEQRDGFVFATRVHVEDDNEANDDDDDDDNGNDNDDDDDNAEFRTEGTVNNRGGTCPAATFTVNSTSVLTSAATRFDHLTCGSLSNGTRVEVRGVRQSSGTVLASRVKLRK